MRTFSLVTQHSHGGSLAEHRHTSTSQPINTESDATTALDDDDAYDAAQWRHSDNDVSSFGDFKYALDAHDVYGIDFHAPLALAPTFLTSSTSHDQDEDNLCLIDGTHFPRDQDLSHGSNELAAQEHCPPRTALLNVDNRIEPHDYVSLQDLELHNTDPEQVDATMQLSGYDLDGSFEFGDFETQAQDLDITSSEIAPQSFQSPYGHNHGRRHGRNGDHRRTRGRVGSRPSAVIKDWYFTHSSSPYPPSEQIAALAALSGLSPPQVRVCLSNLRSRIKPGSRTLRTSLRQAPRDATMHEIQIESHLSFEGPTTYGLGTSAGMLNEDCDNAIQFQSNHLGDSETSLSPSFRPDRIQDQSLTWATTENPPPFVPKRKGRRQHLYRFDYTFSEPTSSSPQISSDNGIETKRPYHCTVCRQSFKDVYGWKRHESSVHGYSDVEWVCMLSGHCAPGEKCIFCSDTINDLRHFKEHDVQSCLNKSICDRTFARKDLLKQHVQQKHFATTDKAISISKAFKVPKTWSQRVDTARIKNETLWCGFCLTACDSIGERMDHVAEHFRNGDDIEDWIPLVTT